MKKPLLLIIATVLLLGCEKNDIQKTDNRLVGTSFRTDAYSFMASVTGHYYHIYEFISSSEGVAYYTDRNGHQNGTDGNFTYRIDYPELYINKDSGGSSHFRFTSARSFVFIKDDGEPNSMVTYYKL